MNHRVCCVLCRKEVSAQGLNGHRRAMHQRGKDMRASNDFGELNGRSMGLRRHTVSAYTKGSR